MDAQELNRFFADSQDSQDSQDVPAEFRVLPFMLEVNAVDAESLDYMPFESTAPESKTAPLCAEAQCIIDILRSTETKKKRLKDVVNEIREIQETLDCCLPEFEAVREALHALFLKYNEDTTTIHFDAFKKKLETHVEIQRARLQELQSERDRLAADIGMIERTLAVSQTNLQRCSICYTNVCNVALMPCGHVYCEICIARFSSVVVPRCPTCRTKIDDELTLFF